MITEILQQLDISFVVDPEVPRWWDNHFPPLTIYQDLLKHLMIFFQNFWFTYLFFSSSKGLNGHFTIRWPHGNNSQESKGSNQLVKPSNTTVAKHLTNQNENNTLISTDSEKQVILEKTWKDMKNLFKLCTDNNALRVYNKRTSNALRLYDWQENRQWVWLGRRRPHQQHQQNPKYHW